MDAISRGFSNRRKSQPKSPRNLPIRKVSFSGCSVDSVGSWSSSSSTCSSSITPTMPSFASRIGSELVIPRKSSDSSRSPQHPPARLAERAFLQPLEECRNFTAPPSASAVSFFDDTTDDEDDGKSVGYGFGDNDAETTELSLRDSQPKTMDLPPGMSPLDHTETSDQPPDYFYYAVTARPPMPRSHWSESTIQTIHSFDDFHAGGDYSDYNDDIDADSELGDDDDETPVAEVAKPIVLPNFSRKSLAPPPRTKRPSVKSMIDSIDEESKSARWKRRGIYFNPDEASACDEVQSE